MPSNPRKNKGFHGMHYFYFFNYRKKQFKKFKIIFHEVIHIKTKQLTPVIDIKKLFIIFYSCAGMAKPPD